VKFENKKDSLFLLLLTMLFVCAVIIKFWNFPFFVIYNSEIAQHYVEIIKLNQGQFLLEGPLTSHAWLRLSSTSYYLFYPFFVLSGYHPLTLPILWLVTSSLIIFLNYVVIKKIFDRTTAILSSFLYLISPNILLLDRNAAFFAFIVPLMYCLLLETHNILKKESKRTWLILLLVSSMCTLHAAAIFLLPFYIGFIALKKLFRKENLVRDFLAILTPQLPFLLVDSGRQFSATIHLFLWLPYKVINFVTGKTLGVDRIIVKDESLLFISNFYKQVIFPSHFPWWIGLVFLIIVLAMAIYLTKKKIFGFETFSLYLLLFGTLSLLVHKNPPAHYFVPIMILPLILVARTLAIFLQNKKWNFFTSLFLIAVGTIAVKFIFSPFYLFSSTSIYNYPLQLKVSKTIINDAQGKDFSLKRIGPFDTYANEFKENYHYLLWWQGNAPKEKAPNTYTIVEDMNRIPVNTNREIFNQEATIVVW
jgi:hypothetical protein